MRRGRLAQRRKAVGLSQERLAEALDVDRSTIVRWEAGETDPQPWNRPRLAHALQISLDQLAALLANHEDVPSLLGVGGLAGAPPAGADAAVSIRLRHQVQSLDRKYDQTPSSSLLAEAGQLYGQVSYLRAQATTNQLRRQLWATEAQSALLLGQLIWDASQRRDHAGAVRHFDHAIGAAREADEPATEAYAELRKCYVALYGYADPTAGRMLAYRAELASRGCSPVIAGLATLHVAEAHAMLGDAQGCDVALGKAQDKFAAVGSADPGHAHFSPTVFGRLAGSCHLFLGQPSKAEPILEGTYQQLASLKKSTAIVLGNLSLACIRQRKVDEGVGRLHQAIDVVEQTRGGGGLNVVFTAARELQTWRSEAIVAEVSDRLLLLMAAG